MGHHLDEEGRFVSDKHDLPPDRIRLNFLNPNSHEALWQLAKSYAPLDPELAEDIGLRLWTLGYRPPITITSPACPELWTDGELVRYFLDLEL